MYRRVLLVVFALLSSQPALFAGPSQAFTFSGHPIVGQKADFLPSVTAVFELVDSVTLNITLTNDTSDEIMARGEVLSGLTWDINSSATLTPVEARIAPGSVLKPPVAPPLPDVTDLSMEWAFRDDLNAGSGPIGPSGSFGISAVGELNFGAETFGPKDLFKPELTTIFGPQAPNGVGGSIVGPNVDGSGFFPTAMAPMVQGNHGTLGPGQMVFTFGITGPLDVNTITNVQPSFGAAGATTVTPEPGSLTLAGSVFALFLGSRILRQRRRGKNSEPLGSSPSS